MYTRDSSITPISQQTVRRIPFYLKYLQALAAGTENTSATVIARALNLNEVQVRKDLASISQSGGRPRTGYVVKELISDIEDFLGLKNGDEAVLVGVGHLGKALLSYKGFDEYGLEIIAGFDASEAVAGTEYSGKMVFPLNKLVDLTKRLNVRIGIITVPAGAAQEVCDMLVEAGCLAIWNFAPIHLNVPEKIMVQNENMAASLLLLSRHLEEHFGKKQEKEQDAAPD